MKIRFIIPSPKRVVADAVALQYIDS
jgi:hypothetical protein